MTGKVKVIIVLISIMVLASIANAQIPRQINYQGLLVDKDTKEALAGPVDLTFRLFDPFDCENGAAPDALWSETHTGVELDNGIFSVRLGSQTAFPDSLRFDKGYCLGIEVGGEELLPRQPLSSVAYSLNSLRADTALVVLEYPSHDHDDRYYTESELNTAGTLNDPGNPVDWTMLKNVPAGFADGVDNTGAGIPGTVLPGAGLSEEIVGDDKILSVAPEGIVETMLADSAVTGEKIRSNSITAAQIAPGAITAGEIASGTITSAQIASSTITAAQISPSTITASEIFSNTLTAAQLASAAVRSDELADSAVTGDKIQPGAVTALQIYDGSILFDDIGQNGASTGQVIKWDGSEWTASDDGEGGVGDITSVTAGSGLTGGGDTLDVILAVAFAGTGSADSVARSDHDHDAVYINEGQTGSIVTGMIVDGTVTSADLEDGTVTSVDIMDGTIAFGDVGQNGAAAGQVMKWDGAQWAAANDSVGAGSGGAAGWVDDGTTVRLEDISDSVGIGTSTPAEKLDVDGNLRVSGTAVVGSGHTIDPGTGVNVTGQDHDTYGDHLVISGGLQNMARASYTTVGGGRENEAEGEYASVGGGMRNRASGRYSVISGGGSDAGGDENRAEGDYAAIGGGRHNIAGWLGGAWQDYAYATVGGGQGNQAIWRYCTVSGGEDNRAQEEYATVGGGMQNVAGSRSVVGGGSHNSALNDNSTVGGGMSNTASNQGTVGGGDNNMATGLVSTVPGGRENEATGEGSFAAGSQAKARHEGSFALSANWPSTGDDSISTGGTDQFVIRADGGIYLTNTSEQAPYNPSRLINTSTGAYLGNDGMWHDSSDRALKENFEPVDGEKLLEKIAGLPVTQWNYRIDGGKAAHIGPVAQDFHEILGIGSDERTIAALDEAGVSLAAIQQLYSEAKRQEREIKGLKKEIEELRKLISTLLEKE